MLLASQPSWVSVQEENTSKVQVSARPPVDTSDLLCREYCLELSANESTISVKEIAESRSLPVACPCRHINNDGSFCLEFNSEIGVSSQKNPVRWWKYLAKYLEFQEAAKKTKIWPQYIDENGEVHNELSHGAAAQHQLDAEKIAAKLGIKAAYDEALFNRIKLQDWLPVVLPVSRPVGRLKKGKPILRRNCPKNNDIKLFIAAEQSRQKEADDFVKSYSKTGCCLDMKHCEFRDKKNSRP